MLLRLTAANDNHIDLNVACIVWNIGKVQENNSARESFHLTSVFYDALTRCHRTLCFKHGDVNLPPWLGLI